MAKLYWKPSVICCIILAAGQSTRMGTSKLVLTLRGRPIIWHVAEAALASGAGEVIAVVGHDAQHVLEALGGLPVTAVHNPHFSLGQSTSIRAGIKAMSPNAEAAVVLLGDQPGVGAELINKLISVYRSTGAAAVSAECDGHRTPPVLLDRSVFDLVAAVSGDQGGREVLRQLGDRVKVVPVDPATVADVNEWGDYQTLVDRTREGG